MSQPTSNERGMTFALKPEDHRVIRTAAGSRGMTVSGYLRSIVVPKARQDVEEYVQQQLAPNAAESVGQEA